MPRRKRGSKILEKARQRLAALKSIDSNFDFGGGVNAVSYEQAIEELETLVDDYNLTLSLADQRGGLVKDKEDFVGDLTERALIGAGTRYGKDSVQYNQAGGIRKSERKKPAPKKKIS